jgi:MFS superfamily sulfate permease-like transporter
MANLAPRMTQHLRSDFSSGLVVCLIALPLCLGIALASGAPLVSGLIAGVIGGIVVGFLSGSEVSVSGPAAGLSVIVLNSIQKLGSFEAFALAVALSGVFQLILGTVRAGILGNYVPNSVIKGMLAAIGIVIILKQIPHALGRDADFEGNFAFFQTEAGTSNTLLDILRAFSSATPTAVLISVVSMLILLIWDRPAIQRLRPLKWIPAPLLVVMVGIFLNEFFGYWSPDLRLSAEEGHLVQIPLFQDFSGFLEQFHMPRWELLADSKVLVTAATLAVVGSLETLLSLEASEKLDPYHRITDPNQELRAQGVGNVLSGLLGGLPITSVIVRSSANIYAGARTRMSAMVHGFLLLVFVLAFPALLNMIPLASLAAILILVGYKLTRLELYRSAYQAGTAHFLPFLITILGVVFTDLLTGIGIGLVVGLFFVFRANIHSAFTLVSEGQHHLLRFNKDASFIHKNALSETLRSIPDGAFVIIDGTRATYVDHDIKEMIREFHMNAEFRGIQIEFKNLDSRPRTTRKRGN